MNKKIIFGRWEAISLVVNMICTQIFLNFPRFMAEAAGTAGWMLTLYVSAVALLLFFLISKLFAYFPGKDLLDVGESIGGSVGRIVIGILFLMVLLSIIPVVLRQFGESMKVITLPISPISFVMAFFIFPMVAGAYLGWEAITRFHGISMPIFATGFLIIVASVIPYFEGSRIMPIFGNGMNEIFGKGFMKVSVLSGVAALYFVRPFLASQRVFRNAGTVGVGLSAFFLTVASASYLLVFPYPSATENLIPIYQLARLIFYGRFFQRVEAAFVLIWASAGILYLTTGLFLIAYIFQKTFKLEYYKPLIVPFAAVVYALSFLPSNMMEAIDMETGNIRSYEWLITFGVPLAVLLAGVMAKKRGKRRKRQDG